MLISYANQKAFSLLSSLKNSHIGFSVDYRKLNRQTMDLKFNYYHVEVKRGDKCKTAFVTPMGSWEINRMPQRGREMYGWHELE